MQGEFEISGEPADTFVKLPGFKKGLIYVNGRLLSRYWEVGPQRSAYLPAPWLKRGVNEITVLELEGFDAPERFWTTGRTLAETQKAAPAPLKKVRALSAARGCGLFPEEMKIAAVPAVAQGFVRVKPILFNPP